MFITGHLSSKKTQFQVWRLGSLLLLGAQEQSNCGEYNPELKLADFNF